MRKLARLQRRWMLGALMGLCVGLGGMAYTVANEEPDQLWHEGALLPEKMESPFAKLAKKLEPAVVNIRVTKKVDASSVEMPFDFFGFRMPHPRVPPTQEGAGSGFIIHKDGYIVTNHHVVDGAQEIEVRTVGGEVYSATVIGSDPKTDVALIKLKDGPSDLPYAPLGDSDKIEIGEWVMAIGNPYGLEHTVTVGIVSAEGRAIGAGPYDDFIQTDASINPGNSGGPLFNTAGEVIGMNTAIIPGGQGLGFAVPVNMVKEILPQLKKSGKVTRAWLGVQVQDLTADLAKQFGIDKAKGALVSQVFDKTAAANAGLKPGDLILRFNATEIKQMRDLPFVVARAPIGVPVEMQILRDGKERTLKVTLDQMQDEGQESAAGGGSPEPTGALGQLGIQVKPVEDEEGGLQIVSVSSGSPAERAQLQEGDVIRSANRQKVRSVADLQESLKASSGTVMLLVERDGRASFVVIQLK
jgi:serine protease Do